ncbi:hypothetical protein lbkm_0527 [Lachnospiraceae bacterium KM106-2]|nr:hypothetical protein lbkm_0527 [Lachnospiraceae bacterium KM106-2]
MKKRNDIILITAILLIAVAGIVFYTVNKKSATPSDKVKITVDTQLYKEVSLNEDQVIEVKIDDEVKNIVEIKDNKVFMREADCPDQVCVHQKTIEKDGELIICLPNKVVVTIEGADSTDSEGTDSVAN